MIASILRIRVIYLLYRLLLWAAFPVLTLYFLGRIRRDRRYRAHFAERLGALPFSYHPTIAGSVWLHAVSVGEVVSAMPLLRELRAERPTAKLFVSCSTVAGRELAHNKLGGLTDGIFYAPLDFIFCVRRVLRQLRPALVVVLETEIWPNLYRESKRFGAAVAVVNGRISDGAFPRYKRLRIFFAAPLSQPDCILVQSTQDRERYVAIGAPAARVHVGGNLKYDFAPGEVSIPPQIQTLLDKLTPEKVWMAASTMPPAQAGDVDEDDVVIDTFRRISTDHDGLLVVLAPRRPERFNAAAEKLDRAGVRYLRRSRLTSESRISLPGVMLLDTIGELSSLFPLADVVLMGGTLARRGGHNILEPASFAKCVVIGPHMENFAEIAAEFREGQAVLSIDGPVELTRAVDALLRDPERRAAMGQKARTLAESKRGVAARLARELCDLYDSGLYQDPGPAALTLFERAWTAGSAQARRKGIAQQRVLPRPVISIGNIAMGGSGKTPMVDWLSRRLRDEGLTPAVLTRGYGRRSVESVLVVPAGADCSVERTGDEAQILLLSAGAHLGIGADRFNAGEALVSILPVDVFLLDDGFQQWRLRRDADILLIDALNPFGGGHVVPRGRLREPLEGLSRAGIIILTRAEPGQSTAAIERVVRTYNSHAPIFRSYVVPKSWVAATGTNAFEPGVQPFRRVAAFCGLGNPNAFWRSLDQLGLDVVFRWSFGDHHRYRAAELRRLLFQARQHGAEALVTTQKDVLNLPAYYEPEIPCWWLRIAIQVEQEDALLANFRDLLRRHR